MQPQLLTTFLTTRVTDVQKKFVHTVPSFLRLLLCAYDTYPLYKTFLLSIATAIPFDLSNYVPPPPIP